MAAGTRFHDYAIQGRAVIPTLSNSIEILIGQLLNGVSDSRELIFAEGILSFLTFGVVNTALGVILFCKRDLK